uniref:Polymerase PB1 n=1 Tax=Hubei orthomyxo-like virus 5 TaxID=1923008 RepID=A0A1L3KKR7_9VIRU|nr:polymerase PB1 [Hubei orthomyxo-like virus 5]
MHYPDINACKIPPALQVLMEERGTLSMWKESIAPPPVATKGAEQTSIDDESKPPRFMREKDINNYHASCIGGDVGYMKTIYEYYKDNHINPLLAWEETQLKLNHPFNAFAHGNKTFDWYGGQTVMASWALNNTVLGLERNNCKVMGSTKLSLAKAFLRLFDKLEKGEKLKVLDDKGKEIEICSDEGMRRLNTWVPSPKTGERDRGETRNIWIVGIPQKVFFNIVEIFGGELGKQGTFELMSTGGTDRAAKLLEFDRDQEIMLADMKVLGDLDDTGFNQNLNSNSEGTFMWTLIRSLGRYAHAILMPGVMMGQFRWIRPAKITLENGDRKYANEIPYECLNASMRESISEIEWEERNKDITNFGLVKGTDKMGMGMKGTFNTMPKEACVLFVNSRGVGLYKGQGASDDAKGAATSLQAFSDYVSLTRACGYKISTAKSNIYIGSKGTPPFSEMTGTFVDGGALTETTSQEVNGIGYTADTPMRIAMNLNSSVGKMAAAGGIIAGSVAAEVASNALAKYTEFFSEKRQAIIDTYDMKGMSPLHAGKDAFNVLDCKKDPFLAYMVRHNDERFLEYSLPIDLSNGPLPSRKGEPSPLAFSSPWSICHRGTMGFEKAEMKRYARTQQAKKRCKPAEETLIKYRPSLAVLSGSANVGFLQLIAEGFVAEAESRGMNNLVKRLRFNASMKETEFYAIA